MRVRTSEYAPLMDKFIHDNDRKLYETNPIDWPEPEAIHLCLNDTPKLEAFLNGTESNVELGFLGTLNSFSRPNKRENYEHITREPGKDVNYFVDIFFEMKGIDTNVDPRRLIPKLPYFVESGFVGLGHTHRTGSRIDFSETDKEFLSGSFTYRPHILFAQNEEGRIVANMYLPGKGTYQISPENILLKSFAEVR